MIDDEDDIHADYWTAHQMNDAIDDGSFEDLDAGGAFDFHDDGSDDFRGNSLI